jgi:hypothetical protein
MLRSGTSRPAREAWALASILLAPLALGAPAYARVHDAAEREAIEQFEREVRPLLAEHCFECHGPEVKRAKGGLRFDSRRSLLEGGDSGPAIAPGDPDASLLLRAVSWTDSDLEMPPDERLPEDAIAKLRRWIENGAAWPDSDPPAAARDAEEPAIDVAAGRDWWAFRPIVRPEPPVPANTEGIRGPIDAFVRAGLERAGLQPSPEADRATLARRLYLGLIGLRPTKEEVDRFVADPADDAFERLVDELLARPEYGERWARHWLDVVRYADTNGYERDEPKPYAWRYRDYVIQALNDDLPYDRFVIEQLAGDEFDPGSARARLATGMLRLGAWDSEPDDPDLAKYDELDDSLRVVTEGFLGVTVGCARCHDHKFDPIPQTDYYGLLAFLRSIRPYEQDSTDLDPPAIDILDRSPQNLARFERERQEAFDDLQRRIEEIKNRGRKMVVAQRLSEMGESPEILDLPAAKLTLPMRRAIAKALAKPITDQVIYDTLGREEARGVKRLLDEQRLLPRKFEGSVERGLVVKEYGRRAIPTHVLIRGQPRSLGPEIAPRFPLALSPDDAAATPELNEETADRFRPSTGRRLVLAKWIASPENPLTARVIVNRIWRQHFGAGIVDTPNDFGKMGDPPSHPELLDWLASEFIANGWSLKKLHRAIVTSATWRQRSDRVDDAAIARDPANRSLWRQNPRRLEAEAIRDSMLAVSGLLDPTRGGPAFYLPLDRNVLAGSSRPGEGWGVANERERRRRSVYAFSKRNLPIPFLEVFDAANSTLPTGSRATTTVAAQALSLLNGSFAGEVANALAASVSSVAPDLQATELFSRVLGRDPDPGETALVEDYLAAEEARARTATATEFVAARIPRRVSESFLALLGPRDVLHAPERGFTILRGRFENPYNTTIEQSDLQGPAVLWDAVSFGEGAASARFRLRGDAPFGSLVVRATAESEAIAGLELRIEPDRARLLHHGAGSSELGAVDGDFAQRWIDAQVRIADGRIEVYLDGATTPAITAADPAPAVPGKAGFRTRDAGIEIAALRVTAAGRTEEWRIESPPPREVALRTLALLLLNTNEFVTVD